MQYEQSTEIGELATALAKAQGEMGAAPKDSDNPFFKSKYADLASVWGACRAALSKNGLAVLQPPVGDPEPDGAGGFRVGIVTELIHASGQWVRSTLYLPLDKQTPQAAGSVLTYARRYALAGMVGVYQEDDDAEAAMPNRNAKPEPKRRAATKPEPPPKKDDRLAGLSPRAQWFIREIEKSTGKDDLEVFWKNMGEARDKMDDKEKSIVTDAYHGKLEQMDDTAKANNEDSLPF